jgi:4-carboxymuconolactone decarboxylase
LPKRLSELIIAMTARHWTAQFEWAAHHHQGLEHGLTAATLEAIRTRRCPDFAKEDEAIVYDFVTQLYANQGMAEEVHERAEAALGKVGVIAIAGYYSSVALICNAFDLEVRQPDPPAPLGD